MRSVGQKKGGKEETQNRMKKSKSIGTILEQKKNSQTTNKRRQRI